MPRLLPSRSQLPCSLQPHAMSLRPCPGRVVGQRLSFLQLPVVTTCIAGAPSHQSTAPTPRSPGDTFPKQREGRDERLTTAWKSNQLLWEKQELVLIGLELAGQQDGAALPLSGLDTT